MDRRVDADDTAGHVDQRAAGVSRVDRRVRLDEHLRDGARDTGAPERGEQLARVASELLAAAGDVRPSVDVSRIEVSLGATSDLPIFADQNGDQYAVSARPLLPYESIQSALTPDPIIPSPDVIAGTVPLTCSSDDGVLPIP